MLLGNLTKCARPFTSCRSIPEESKLRREIPTCRRNASLRLLSGRAHSPAPGKRICPFDNVTPTHAPHEGGPRLGYHIRRVLSQVVHSPRDEVLDRVLQFFNHIFSPPSQGGSVDRSDCKETLGVSGHSRFIGRRFCSWGFFSSCRSHTFHLRLAARNIYRSPYTVG